MLRRSLLCLTLSMILCTAARADDDPAAIAREFATATITGDAHTVSELWVAGDARDLFLGKFERERATHCRQLLALDVTHAETTGDNATVIIESSFAEWNARGALRQRHRAFRAELTRAGTSWRITRWQNAAQWTAQQIAATESPDERLAIARSSSQAIRADLPEALSRAAVTLMNQSRQEAARDLMTMAIALAEESGEPAAMAHALGVRSVFLRLQLHDMTGALAIAERAAALGEESGDPDALANALLRQGRAQAMFDFAKAIAIFKRAFSLEDDVEDPTVVALIATQLALYYDETGEVRSGLRYALEAKRYADLSGDPAAQISADLNVGGSYLQLGDGEMAAPLYRHAMEAAERAKFSMVALSAGLMYARIQGDDARVDEIYSEIEHTGDPIADATMHAEAILHFGHRCHDAGGSDAEVEEYVHRALKTAGENTSGLWSPVADMRVNQGRYEEATALIDMMFAGGPGSVFGHSWHTRSKVRALDSAGDKTQAIAYARREAEWVERTLASVPFSSRQMRLFVRNRDLHESLAWLLWEDHRDAEALGAADAAKARILRSLVNGSRLDVMSPQVSVEKASAEESVVQINRALRSASPDDRDAIAHLQDELREARTQLRRLELLAQPAPAAVYKAESDPSAFLLPEGTVGLQYVVREQSTLLFTFGGATPATRWVRSHRIQVPRDALQKDVEDFIRALEKRDAGWRAHAQRLHRLLLAPAAHELATAKNAIIVPHRVLWGVPFHALIEPKGQPLIDRVAVEYRLAMDLGRPPVRKQHHANDGLLLAFANPVREGTRVLERNLSPADIARALPDAETEARSLRALYAGKNTRVYVGAEAQESTFKELAPQAHILHIATHAFADPAWPMYSALLFARPHDHDGEDGILEAREIASMQLDADVAVLSACETGRGEYDWDEGVVGLPWAFLAAGTPTVVVSQWKVASQPTAQLMIAFHARLRHPGTTPAQALRGAQREMRAQTRHAHPFYWAPFVAITR